MLFNFSHFLCARFVAAEELTLYFPRKSANYLFTFFFFVYFCFVLSLPQLVAAEFCSSLFVLLDTFHYTTSCTPYACFTFYMPKGGGRSDCLQMGMAFVVFENGISSCNFYQRPFDSRTPLRCPLVICCFMTLVECIQFNASFPLPVHATRQAAR